jgi:hypothetical protein
MVISENSAIEAKAVMAAKSEKRSGANIVEIENNHESCEENENQPGRKLASNNGERKRNISLKLMKRKKIMAKA